MVRQTTLVHFWSLLALFSTFQHRVAGQYFNGFDAFAQQKLKCKAYKCDKGYEPVPKKNMVFQSPGCGNMGNVNMDFFGGDEDEENGKPYESCCHQWHACNQICGISKQNCDESYTACAQDKCKGKEDPPSCVEQANRSMMMNNLSGCKSFEVVQSKACQCVTKYEDRHVKQRQEALHNFYKLHAPKSSIKKVPDLVKKADTMAKMAKLIQKLIRKYPDAIELVEDPQTKMYRQMFGNAGAFGGADFGNAGFGGDGKDDFDDVDDLEEDDDEDDFDVHEDLGEYGEDEEEEVKPPPPKKKERKPEKKKERKPEKKKPTFPPVQELEKEEEEEKEEFDEFNQYEEL